MATEFSILVEPVFGVERYRFLRRRVQLDLLSLDEELQEITSLIQDACEMAAKSNERRDVAKDQLVAVEAAAAYDLRRVLNTVGKSKSETQIESEIPLDDNVMKMKEQYNERKLDAALWSGLSDTLRTKSSGIRAAADLIQAGYLSTNFIQEKRRAEIRAVTSS